MKRIFLNALTMIVTGSLLLTACEKDETKVIYDGGTAPVLMANHTDSIPMPVTDTTSEAVTFSWTNPDYKFSNGISSLDVTYYLQVDTSGANFGGPNMQTVAIPAVLSQTFTVSSLNNLLVNGLKLQTGVAHKIDTRVRAFLGNGSVPLLSNTLSYSVTPYSIPKITPPASGTLFIVGDATPGGWNNPMSVDPATQQFAQISTTLYKITIQLNGGKEYKFISVNGSWANQWSVAVTDTFPNGGDFVFNGNNCIAPAASGKYDITVNFQTGKFSVTPH